MRAYRLHQFGIENLKLENVEPPRVSPGHALIDVKAISLNYRDLMVVKGMYNPKMSLPATPISDGAGVVAAVGEGVTRVQVGDRVMGQFVTAWIDGPFRQEYPRSTLGTPGPGLAAEQVVLPAEAIVPAPRKYEFAPASTLPIAALTAWSGLVTEGQVAPGQTVLTLGTGGVSVFAVQIAKALGAKVIITSSSDEKLERAKKLGADHGVNYRTAPDWERAVLELTGGLGADVTIENGGPGTLDRSVKATRAGGLIALLGALTGREGAINTGFVLMRRMRIHGIMVDSRAAFEALVRFIEQHGIQPVIDRRFRFEQLPEALRFMESAQHFGKIVVTL
jgi:NADPH:quinone reductase-like Zn-dependent oxidoreductase